MVAVFAGLVAPQASWAQAQPEIQSAQSDSRRTFSVPVGPLANALTIFGQQAGLQVSVDPTIVQGVSSPGVSGSLSIDQALARLLAGTGLTHRIVGNTVTLQKPGAASGVLQLDPVQVQGYPVPSQAMIDNLPLPYAGGQVATGGQVGLLGNRDVMDMPFNQTNYTARKVQDQQARTVRDALIDDPSVREVWPATSSSAQNMTIRGFGVGNGDIAFGGLYGVLPTWSIAAELPERVEVLKGPSIMLNGMPPSGAIGGAVNLIAKRAPDEPLNQFTLNYASASQFGVHADVARRFGADKQFGVRANGLFRSGQTAVQYNADQMALASLGLDFRGENVRVSIDGGYQYQYIWAPVNVVSIGTNVPIPGAPTASSSFSQPWSTTARNDLFGVLRAEVDMTERITAYAAFGAHDNRALTLEGAQGGRPVIVNTNGNVTQTPLNQSVYFTTVTGEAGLRALVDTGPISHAFNIAATVYEQTNGVGQVLGRQFTSNIYTPTVTAPPALAMPAANKASVTGRRSLAFADTLSAADKRIQLTAGARLQQVTASNYNITTGAMTTSYDQSALSPSVALVFKPWQNVSIYGNFIQGLQQGTIIPAGFANAGQIFAPFVSTQYEAGVKVDWGRFTTTLSAFQITQPSTVTDVATNTLVLAGQQRNRGLEINVFGEPLHGVRLLGGVMFLDAVLTQTQGGLTDGWTAAGAPNVQLNLGGEWDLPFARGFTVDGRVVYTGQQYVNVASPRQLIPEWTRLDIGARYTFDNVMSPTGKPITIRFNVDNLLDSNYWAGVTNTNSMFQGAPRFFRLSTTFGF